MKIIFDNRTLDIRKPIHINSALHPAGGYVAKPNGEEPPNEESRDTQTINKRTRGSGYVATPENNTFSIPGIS